MQGKLSLYKNRARAAAGPLLDWADENWSWVVFLVWVALATYLLQSRQPQITWFALGDTDDNMRYLQVRDWLAGQGWYDLRQYRLDPPGGANIHWSRLVDLPLAALMLFFRLFLATGDADRIACAVAPVLPMLLLMLSLAFIVRRLGGGVIAWLIAAVGVMGAPMGLGMYMPLRVDHHGWQLALAVTMLAGIVDRKWLRGGVVAGLASALSLAIGMEMIVYIAVGGALIGLRWIFKHGAARRMLPYGVALGGGVAACFVLFASYANRGPVCDALSPVWVSTLGLAAAGMVLLARVSLARWWHRLLAGLVLLLIVGGFIYLNWPQCVTSAYQISPELQAKWLANIREAKPVLSEPLARRISLLTLPVAGALAALAACWIARRDSERLWAWGTVALMTLFALGMTFWQIRAAPAAQLLAIPAVAWGLGGALTYMTRGGPWRATAGLLLALVALGAFNAADVFNQWHRATANTQAATPNAAATARSARLKRIERANARCRTLPALARLDRLPPATIMTLVDLGPRLIAVTHHSAIAGPYHRNGKAILDLHHAYDGQDGDFLRVAAAHHAGYFLFCPDFPEGTVYQSRSPKGFYARLLRGQAPGWLKPVDLGWDNAPYTLYRIEYALAAQNKKIAQQRR